MFTILILCFSTLKLKCLIFNKFSFNSNLELSTINDKVCITALHCCMCCHLLGLCECCIRSRCCLTTLYSSQPLQDCSYHPIIISIIISHILIFVIVRRLLCCDVIFVSHYGGPHNNISPPKYVQ